MDMSNFWDDRYRDGKYIYGTNPNAFFKEYIIKHPIGTILLPAEGEGRNAVYAAQCGWKVEAFDLSKGLEQSHKISQSTECKHKLPDCKL